MDYSVDVVCHHTFVENGVACFRSYGRVLYFIEIYKIRLPYCMSRCSAGPRVSVKGSCIAFAMNIDDFK